jgi:hypothetical protein
VSWLRILKGTNYIQRATAALYYEKRETQASSVPASMSQFKIQIPKLTFANIMRSMRALPGRRVPRNNRTRTDDCANSKTHLINAPWRNLSRRPPKSATQREFRFEHISISTIGCGEGFPFSLSAFACALNHGVRISFYCSGESQ